MAVVVVGGHSRNVGKTSVVAGLIQALPEFHWTAFKITQYGHGICSRSGDSCGCASADHTWAISEEKDNSGESDTSRFLTAGADRVWWVRTEQGRLAEAVPAIRRRIADAENAILESNSILKFVRPELYLTILDPSTEDFKSSAREFLDRADAIILHSTGSNTQWSGVSLKPVASKPMFEVHPPNYLTSTVIDFVREHLRRSPVINRSHTD